MSSRAHHVLFHPSIRNQNTNSASHIPGNLNCREKTHVDVSVDLSILLSLLLRRRECTRVRRIMVVRVPRNTSTSSNMEHQHSSSVVTTPLSARQLPKQKGGRGTSERQTQKPNQISSALLYQLLSLKEGSLILCIRQYCWYRVGVAKMSHDVTTPLVDAGRKEKTTVG